MHHRSLLIGAVAVAYGLLAGATTAQAAIATWVSGTGTDAGNCAIAAPCKTFAFAHGQTNGGGSINVLSSGNFGPLTITKSISIVAQGVEGLISSGNSDVGIFVNAGPNAIVSLRGLTIDMRGNQLGIFFVSGAALHLHNSVIRNSEFGLVFAPDSGTSELYIADTTIAESTDIGIVIQPGSGNASAKVVLDGVRVENGGGQGVVVAGSLTTGSIVATIRNSVVAGNANTGISVGDTNSGTTTVMMHRAASMNNGTAGILVDGASATVRIGNSTVSGNTTGLSASSGAIISYGTNKVNGNGGDGAPTSTIATK